MTTSTKHRIHGQVTIKGEQGKFYGDELLYIAVRDSLRYDAECIELGAVSIHLQKGQHMPITYQCPYDPNKAHMKFEQLKSIPGGITILASIERNEQLLYKNNSDLPIQDEVNIELVKIE